MIRTRTLAAALTLCCAVLFSPQSAFATAFCQPKQTADGFVALRNGPSPSARMIGRMKPEDEVQLGQNRKGDWIEVIWWRGDDRLVKGFDQVAGRGWVHRRLIEQDCG